MISKRDDETQTGFALRLICEEAARKERAWLLDVIAEWANDEGIAFDATERLSKRIEEEKKWTTL